MHLHMLPGLTIAVLLYAAATDALGWGEWTPCPKPCGGATQFKVDYCHWGSVRMCPKTYRSCNTHACKSRKRCPVGYKFRYGDRSRCCKKSTEECGVPFSYDYKVWHVVGGSKTEDSEWPWAAALLYRSDHSISCGGSLIHKRWILTAAHCFKVKESRYVLVGSRNLRNPELGSQKFEIETHHVHPDYTKFPLNDIALVKLDHDAILSSSIKPVCLPSGEIVPYDTTCIFIGWGQKNPNKPRSVSNKLRQVALRVLKLDVCQQSFLASGQVKLAYRMDAKQHMCVGRLTSGFSSCGGDSGGPLVCQRCSSCGWFLAATLAGSDCGVTALPGVYMDVRQYEQWIREYISMPSNSSYSC